MTNVFINELHYENIFWDVGEGVEIAGPAGTDLAKWSLVFYSGHDHKKYLEKPLKGLIPNLQNGFGTVFFAVKGIKGDSKSGAGIALIDDAGKVRQFLSFEGADGFTAADGQAAGTKSTKIPVKESSTNVPGHSLQLVGEGNKYEDFKWTGPVSSSFGKVNKGQRFVKSDQPAPSQPSGGTGPATVSGVDTNTEQNRKLHYTTFYHAKEMLVLRRGFEFTIRVSVSGAASGLTVLVEDFPDKAAKAALKVLDKFSNASKWEAYADAPANGSVTVHINIPADVPVGQYTLAIQDGSKIYPVQDPITILFNPWCPSDLVYMADPLLREEYIDNDDGLIWVGSVTNNGPRAWNYGQFDTKSLLCSLLLLEPLPFKERGNPIIVARHLSAIVNSNDDNGVLSGNWSGKYEGGQNPSSWTGSADILKQYYLNRSPVKYGQCWVFSGVLTAVCRSLGIPARSVTNFASAHDTSQPFNRAVDKYFKRGTLEEDEDKTTDSIWNFHVWNDVWTARPDLKNPKYNGWQAIDATPQERSNRVFRTGPCPVVAIKNGEKNIEYDLEFIYSEVSADIKHWVEKEDGKGYDLVKTITDGVGAKISTKAVGSNARDDVTLQYKYAEGSVAERAAHEGAKEGASETKGDVFSAIEAPIVKLGQPVNVKVNLQRREGAPTTPLHANVQLVVVAVSYAGRRPTQQIKDTKGIVNVPVSANQAGALTLTIKPEEYLKVIEKDYHYFKIRAFISIQENKEVTLLETDFSFENNPIVLTYLGTLAGLRVGVTGKVRVTWTNPLKTPLTNAVLRVEGQGLTKVQTFNIGTIAAGATINQEVDITAWEEQNHFLMASIDSKELQGVTGHVELLVLKA